MAESQLTTIVRQIHRLVTAPELKGRTDQQLLREFCAKHLQAAFTTLVERHGTMVMGVCRNVLHHQQDAEDAFQATFLVLARKAASLKRNDALAGWLHGV